MKITHLVKATALHHSHMAIGVLLEVELALAEDETRVEEVLTNLHLLLKVDDGSVGSTIRLFCERNTKTKVRSRFSTKNHAK